MNNALISVCVKSTQNYAISERKTETVLSKSELHSVCHSTRCQQEGGSGHWVFFVHLFCFGAGDLTNDLALARQRLRS